MPTFCSKTVNRLHLSGILDASRIRKRSDPIHQPLYDELRKLRKHFPEKWEQLRQWDRLTWRTFVKHYSVEQLERRFAFEDDRLAQGLPIKGKAFFDALKEHMKECDL